MGDKVKFESLVTTNGSMAELVDAADLKSSGPQGPCGFESRWSHNYASVTKCRGFESFKPCYIGV